VFGDWKAYEDFSAMKNKEDLLVIGAGVNWTQGGDSDVYFHTVDVQYEGSGLPISVYAAYIGQQVESGEDDADEGYNWGGLAQVGYMLNDNWEIFGRYDYTDIEDADDEYSEITAGVNYYFAGHNAKVTVDVIYLPDGSPSSQSGIGVQGGDNDQYAIRGQFQLQL
jgi:hypothetical protein